MRWGLVVAWASLIFYLSSQPDLHITPNTSWDFVLRKLAHMFVFGVLALLILNATRTKRVVGPFILTVVYAISDEIHQNFVPTRQGAVSDVLIDAIGATIGLALWMLYQNRKNKH